MTNGDRGDTHPLIHRLPIRKDGRIVAHKEVASYRGLLHKAHETGLVRVETKLIQFPSNDNGNTAIVHATVHISKGVFTGIGDANPKNVNPKVAPHAIRMAETRAEARAFRKALDIGVVSLEELEADLDDGLTYEGAILPAGGSRRVADAPKRNREALPPAQGSRSDVDDFRATERQRKFLFRLVHEAGWAGDEARNLIHRELGARSVAEASKGAVSSLIDRLKAGEFTRSNGHAGAAE